MSDVILKIFKSFYIPPPSNNLHLFLPNGNKIVVFIASGNCLSPIWCEVSDLTNDYTLSIGPLGTNFRGIFNQNQIFYMTKIHLNMLRA